MSLGVSGSQLAHSWQSIPAGVRGSCPPPQTCPGRLPRSSAAAGPTPAPQGLASRSKPCQPVSVGRTRPQFLGSCGRIPAFQGRGAPSPPLGLGPISAASSHSPVASTAWMDGCSFHTGLAEPGGCVTRPPAGRRGPPLPSGVSHMHPSIWARTAAPPQPQGTWSTPPPRTLHPPSTLLPSLAPQPTLGSPSEPLPPTPLPYFCRENCTQPSRPSRDSPSSEGPPEPPLLTELRKISPRPPTTPFSLWHTGVSVCP